MIEIGTAEANHDGHIFRQWGFGSALLEQQLSIPTPKVLPRTNLVLLHFFVADQAFPLHVHIMRAYPGEHLSERKKILIIVYRKHADVSRMLLTFWHNGEYCNIQLLLMLPLVRKLLRLDGS
ncbi:hypothetical protein ILUMI_00978 [Ignelater luminosus]|uniref:Uncharacterized protein n=1 Tax=Ignelater luminosus TaxID=2038154 RepID=A0A8K0DJ75_IGNLU|nr:hypothetical protein ILUMI_00978 [Ignelater luminosus]